jgi:hypothetical protein
MRWSSHRANGWVPAQLRAGLAHVLARLRGDLEHGLVELGLDVAGVVVAAALLQQPFDRIGQLPALRVEDHQLFLDAHGVAGAGEVRLHGAGG